MQIMCVTWSRLALVFLSLSTLASGALAARPHAVFVVGTPHYEPAATMPELARQLRARGFRTTVVMAEENPERNPKGISGLEALKDADVAIFYMRFLRLPTDQLKIIQDYVRSGKPVVGFRTSTHAFSYAKDDPNHGWNDAFGKDVLGSKYFVHLAGRTTVIAAGEHEILQGVDFRKPRTAAGSLYLSELPADAEVLLRGTGNSKKVGTVKNAFGSHELKQTMTDDVAWTWTNRWKGRVFATTLGHPETFADPNFVQFFLNGIQWAAGSPITDDLAATPIKSATGKKGKSGTAKKGKKKRASQAKGRKNRPSAKKPSPEKDPELLKYGIYEQSAARGEETEPVATSLPLKLAPGARIALIGNNLFDRSQYFGYLEALLHQRHPKHQLVVRNLAWSGDTPDLRPRPANFADLGQHLTHEKVDVIFAAFGFNESFAGDAGAESFRQSLTAFVSNLKRKAFNGKTGPQIVLVSPTANEKIAGVDADEMNNANIEAYTKIVESVASEQRVGFVNVYDATRAAMSDPTTDLTINGSHLDDAGYRLFADTVYEGLFQQKPMKTIESIRQTVLDKNRQYFRRYRPANTFYYTGGRNKSYGYLDFLPAMRNFDRMVANRDERIWALAQSKPVPEIVNDSNVPPLPITEQSRGANQWMSAKDEQAAFTVDPRFEVNLFAGEEEFPDIAAPIQMRWDAKGRLWVSCSTTYPHVYPGNKPNDKLVILEDTDGDGKADKSSVFADDLNIPLSFEFGDGGVYVSEMPHLTFIKDTDGDGKADYRRIVLSGFGTEDSHHALHDIAWTPDGDLIFRESIFHHSQVETPYGPVRQQNSGWFRYQPRNHRLLSFGTYHSTNPWGVTFDDWGQHQASHPVFASAFHALDPPYPTQHPRPAGLRAYSGVCGQEFVDFKTFPDELQGGFIKVRYKPTNRVEIHNWKEDEFGYDEEYVSDLIFSSNLSFIPVDIRYGPAGAMYVCDWYNPVKGHAQYSLRDDRRDRHSGRIWRITTKGKHLQQPPRIAGATVKELLEIHKRPEYRYRYWAKRELRERNPSEVEEALAAWVSKLDPKDPRYRHHQVEAVWLYRNIDRLNAALLRDVLSCEEHHARAAATRQLRYWHSHLPDAIGLLRKAANDPNGLVRMEAAIAASYIGSKDALDAILDVYKHPLDGHLAYAVTTSLGSHTLRRHWENKPGYNIRKLITQAAKAQRVREPQPSASQALFDTQRNLKFVKIECLPERMRFSVEEITATVGQPIKILFTNSDATDHNMVFVRPGALAEVGMAANEMAKDPKNANSDFVPAAMRSLILNASPMIGPTRKSRVHVFRFTAPKEPGIYSFVCTFPGHWIIMKGDFVVGKDKAEINALLASRKPTTIKKWTLDDFSDLTINKDEPAVMRGMQAFMKANCHQCHQVAGRGTDLGPDLKETAKRLKGIKLLQQIIEPSTEVGEEYKINQFLLHSGKLIAGVIVKETDSQFHIIPNLLAPKSIAKVAKRDIDERIPAKLSPMPQGLLDQLTRAEIADLVSYLEAGGYQLPDHLKHKHDHSPKP
jgi:putative heme-binding domain-containing protein